MHVFVAEGKGYLCPGGSLLWIQEEPDRLDLYQVDMGKVSR